MNNNQAHEKTSAEVIISNKRGLHLRLAGEIAKLAASYSSSIRIRKDKRYADAKSTLALMSLVATDQTRLQLIIEGEDAGAALLALQAFFRDYSSDI